MFRSPFPRPESEAVHMVDLLVEEPVMVHTGSPPCLKCALAPYAAVAVMPRARSTATARIVRRIPTSLGFRAVRFAGRDLPFPIPDSFAASSIRWDRRAIRKAAKCDLFVPQIAAFALGLRPSDEAAQDL